MFVGGSSVCLIDECTSGLGPLSRRIIWEILLRQRSRRSIILTTHFLDEIDVLADHIVILSKGKVRCQGPTVELKNLYGGGYKVLVPLAASNPDLRYPQSIYQDRLVYSTPDSRSAAELCSTLDSNGVKDVSLSGPRVEDVFLRVADEPGLEAVKGRGAAVDSEFEMSSGQVASFWSQVGTLFRKRFTFLRKLWWPFLYVLALPLIITPNFKNLLKEYGQPSCAPITSQLSPPQAPALSWDATCVQWGCDRIAIASQSANSTLKGLVDKGFQEVDAIVPALYAGYPVILDDRHDFLDFIASNATAGLGGVFMGSSEEAPVLAYRLHSYGSPSGATMISLWSQMNSGVEIIASRQGFAETR